MIKRQHREHQKRALQSRRDAKKRKLVTAMHTLLRKTVRVHNHLTVGLGHISSIRGLDKINLILEAATMTNRTWL